MPSVGQATERRGYPRVTFSALLRPQLRLSFGTHPVVDASQTGIRVLHAVPARPAAGSLLHGTLEWPHGEPPLQMTGTIVRVERGDIAVQFERDTIPPGYLPTA